MIDLLTFGICLLIFGEFYALLFGIEKISSKFWIIIGVSLFLCYLVEGSYIPKALFLISSGLAFLCSKYGVSEEQG